MEIDISPSRLRLWCECCENMDVYGENDKRPLLDVVQCEDGTQIKIYVKRLK